MPAKYLHDGQATIAAFQVMRTLMIDGRPVGDGHPCFVVAEVSANHSHNLQTARNIIHAAKDAGADAVKLQTYTPDTMTIDAGTDWFRIPVGNTWGGTRLYELYQTAYTPWEWHAELKDAARSEGLAFFSTPFDATAVDFLCALGVPAFKIASFELIDIPLLKRVGREGKPVILSTGMATLDEIAEAVATLREAGAKEIALLKCTSAYPARPSAMNLRAIPHLAATFDVVSGLSDHTLGSTCAIGAVALGAAVIEKHLTLSRAQGGPDASFSMEPHEFAEMVGAIRQLETALGRVCYERTEEEEENLRFRRSLFVVRDVRKGERLTPDNVRSIRPGQGLAPRHLDEVLGCLASRNVAAGTPLSWDLIGERVDTQVIATREKEQPSMTLRLRRATKADCRLLWEWANDPAVRAASFNTEAISWLNHVEWFEARIHSDRCVMYIVESSEGVPVGQVRFEVDPGISTEVGVSLAGEWRGGGLSAQVLRLACAAYHAQASEILVAHVRPDNHASVRAFEQAGFQRHVVERVAGCEALRLELRPRDAVASKPSSRTSDERSTDD